MNSLLLLLLLMNFNINRTEGLLLRTTSCAKANQNFGESLTSLHFKKKDEGNGGGDGKRDGLRKSIWTGIKRFLPDTSRAKMEESYKIPSEDSGNRYHIRLIEASLDTRRHTITRLRRFIPDLSWETAEEMVNIAIDEGVSLIRVLNSKNDVKYLVDMLKAADPPVLVEVYDTKADDLIVV